MVYLNDWEDFEIAAENMFMQNPNKCRFTLKYQHSKGLIQLKFTDNMKVIQASHSFTLGGSWPDDQSYQSWILLSNFQCLQYKTEIMPDLKKIEKLTGNLMLHMATNN